MSYIETSIYKSRFGELIIGTYNNKLCLCDWYYRTMRDRIDNRIKTGLKADYINKSNSLIDRTITELEEYFDYQRKSFNVPLLLVGSNFQKSVWESLLSIPFGITQSYKTQAQNLGMESSIRAIASANGANSISIIVPCHRVIGSDGNLTGYAGGLAVKKRLLELEQDMFIKE